MRLYIFLIFTAIGMAFSTGYIALFLQGTTYHAAHSDILKISRVKDEFQREVDPLYIINFNSLYFSKDQFQLLDPRYTFADQTIVGKKNHFYTREGCKKPLSHILGQSNLRKVWAWEEFRCLRRLKLPLDFFVEPPFIHPSGKSYAYLAYRLGRGDHGERAWVMAHLPFFHVSELSELRRKYGKLQGVFAILENIGERALGDLVRGRGTILTKNYLFARLTYPQIFNILEYRIYDREELDNFLREKSPYVLTNFKRGHSCFYRDGSLCWDYNMRHIFRLANTSTLLLFFGLIIIVLIVVRLLLVKLRAQRLEDEQRRLALRVLTHEFRTPITSLILLLEKMGKKYELFDEDLEEVYLRLSREVHRLRHLTESSRHYLKVQNHNRLLLFNFERISSLNTFVEDIVFTYKEKYGEKILFEGVEGDISIKVDIYWLGICLKNLIENSVTHGKFPVRIKLKRERNKVIFSVEDQGSCQFESLGIMTKEFVKGNKSSGTGLGMNIVKKVCREMNVGLKLELNPTTFSLVIPLSPQLK